MLRGCWGGEEHSAPRVLPSSPWSWDEGAAQVNFSHPTPFPVDPLKFVKYLISSPFLFLLYCLFCPSISRHISSG